MHRKAITAVIYLSAAAADSWFWVTRNQEYGISAQAWMFWLVIFVVPLLFVFAYPRYLFARSPSKLAHLRLIASFHAAGAVIATVLFANYGAVFWRNPLRDNDSMALLLIPLVALPVFLVTALSLLFRNKSMLATLASFLFWPYWLMVALIFVGRFFQETKFNAVFCFLCFLAAVLFAFAAGLVSYRQNAAQMCAIAGVVALPWIYGSTLVGNIYANEWIIFNVPDRELPMYKGLATAGLTITSVALIVLAIATGVLRLLPDGWVVRRVRVCERTWPAVAVSVLFLALWFSQSVMPYRIPGALDFSSWPVLQILHVEKRGLQFHEMCVRVWGRRDQLESVSFSGNDRRLFEYRFHQRFTQGELSASLVERIGALIQSSKSVKSNREPIKPLRRWNDDGWYVAGESIELKAYTTENRVTPPQEVIDLFHDLEKIPRGQETSEDRKDVCLGFCYDPLSGLGSLYANHRCRYEGNRYVCR